MKRLIIAIVITITLLSVNVWIMLDLKSKSDQLIQSIHGMQQALQSQQYDRLEEDMVAFDQQWTQMEKGMSHYIRHNHLDNITSAVSRLPALVRYQAFHEVYADLDQVQSMLEHLVEYETPSFFGLFDSGASQK